MTPAHTTSADDALLVEVSAAERSNIANAREACDRAKDSHAAAEGDARKSRDEQSSASQDREAASVKVAKTEAALSTAVAKGTTDDVANAKRDLQSAKAEHAIQEATTVLRGKQSAYATALAELAKEHVRLAEARVELAKARAVNTLDRPITQKPDVSLFEQSVRRAEADENVARAKSDAAQKEVEIATGVLKDRERSAGPR